jgi:general nucleoside transport system permease protein
VSAAAVPAARALDRTVVRGIAWASIGVAVFGLWLMLPPVGLRSSLWIFLIEGLAAVFCAAAAGLGEKRLGWSGVAVAGGCVLLGWAATQSSVGHLDGAFITSSGPGVVDWGTLIGQMFVFATPIAFASLGGLYAERSGVVNIGLEGMMLSGCFFGILVADKASSWPAGILAAMLSGAVLGLVYSFLAIHMRADQIVGGTAINFLALGITGYFFIQVYGADGTPGNIPSIPNVSLKFLDHIPPHSYGPHSFWYNAIGQLNLMTWLLFALLIASSIFMFRTPWGLRLRSVGEHPRAADTVGIDVYKVRYLAVITSSTIVAMGGAYLAIGYTHSFTENMTNGRGFIGLAALIAGSWRPGRAFCFALMFGFFLALSARIQGYGYEPQVFVQALPYIVTLIAVVGVVGRSIPPAAVGRPYVKQ